MAAIDQDRKRYGHILERIRSTLASASYLVPGGSALGQQRDLMEEVGAAIEQAGDPEQIRRRIHQLHGAGRIDRVMMLSALGVLAASPAVRDWEEAARLASQQEFAALELGGPHRERYLASAYRHRGVITFLRGWYATALDWFTRALERETSAENVGNVLATLIRLGEHEEAVRLLAAARITLGPEQAAALDARLDDDDDLARLRAARTR